jgi:hypothetical protein
MRRTSTSSSFQCRARAPLGNATHDVKKISCWLEPNLDVVWLSYGAVRQFGGDGAVRVVSHRQPHRPACVKAAPQSPARRAPDLDDDVWSSVCTVGGDDLGASTPARMGVSSRSPATFLMVRFALSTPSTIASVPQTLRTAAAFPRILAPHGFSSGPETSDHVAKNQRLAGSDLGSQEGHHR